MDFREFLNKGFVILDGGMGTLLQSKGLCGGEAPEGWNISRPEIISAIHKEYYDGGSNVVSTNTFGANILKYPEDRLRAIISAAVDNAKRARDESIGEGERFIALDIGPTGRLLEPLGDLSFEEAAAVFGKTAEIGAFLGVDLIFIETMNDSLETKAAVVGVKEACDLPIMVSNAYCENGKLLNGASAASMAIMLEGLGVDAYGANCSFGPEKLLPVARELLSYASVPVLLKPNAGMPRVVDGQTRFDVSPAEFAASLASAAEEGVRIMGGCCGTAPPYISALCDALRDRSPLPLKEKDFTAVCSYGRELFFGKEPILIGERLNPTGKKRLKEALLKGDTSYILSEALSQQEAGVHALDVNAGMTGIDEAETLRGLVKEIQRVCPLPLQLDSASPQALEAAMRVCNGKPLINSVNGKAGSMEKIFPLVKKYGGVLVALTLDEEGIPETAEGRLAVAEKILNEAQNYGIKKRDIIFDPLAMAVSADGKAPEVTLRTLKLIRENLGCHTVLGVSNVSFGLPCRSTLTSVFFALALENGLSAAIMNPLSAEMMGTYRSFRALKGLDASCIDYMSAMSALKTESISPDTKLSLREAVERGLSLQAKELTEALVKTKAPLDIVKGELIPALDRVGADYEAGRVFLPGLISAADSAKAAFEIIKKASSGADYSKGTFVIATVEGDVHDIGKNIVSLVLENYGYRVIDMGKNVPAEDIVRKVKETGAAYCGLSALMTTTVSAMERTVELLKKEAPFCKVLAGGAVLTEEYAKKMGAIYAADPMEAVRILEGEKNEIKRKNKEQRSF